MITSNVNIEIYVITLDDGSPVPIEPTYVETLIYEGRAYISVPGNSNQQIDRDADCILTQQRQTPLEVYKEETTYRVKDVDADITYEVVDVITSNTVLDRAQKLFLKRIP